MSIVGSAGSGLGGVGDIGGALGSFYGHKIGQSVRLNDDDSAYLTRTPSADSNLDAWTYSTWIKLADDNEVRYLLNASIDADSSSWFMLAINGSRQLDTRQFSSSYNFRKISTAVFRDQSAWYNIIMSYDSTNGTAEDRIKLYVNGVRITVFGTNTNPSSGQDSFINQAHPHTVGCFVNNNGGTFSDFADIYFADTNLIDGTVATPSSFGETKDGIWIPKNTSGLTFGTNGFRLQYAETGTSQNSSGIGADTSGEDNHFAVSGLAATDVLLDSPTNNFPTMNPEHKASSSVTLSEGNLKAVMNSTVGSGYVIAPATMSLPLSGKWYWEGDFSGANTGGSLTSFAGVFDSTIPVVGKTANFVNSAGDYIMWYSHKNSIRNSSLGNTNNFQSHIDTQASGTVSFAIDMDNRWVWVAVNGIYINGTPDFSNGTNRVFILTEGVTYLPFFAHNGGSGGGWQVNFGQDNTNVSSANSDSNGIGTFEYAVPSGYTALCSANLPEPDIIDSDKHFNTVLWTGTGNDDLEVTGVGFSPSWSWMKRRDATGDQLFFDVVRGNGQQLKSAGSSNSPGTSAESTQSTKQKTFTADGFTLGTDATVNTNNGTYVAWNWLGGTTASGSESGNNPAFSSSSNSESGFSIVSYTGTGAAGTVGHGCGAIPSYIIIKNRDATDNWAVYYGDNTDYLILNTTAATADAAAWWNDTTPTDSVFTVGTDHAVNADGEKYIAYCFAEINGFSKVGSYTGNGDANGTYVYTGFRPAWILVKRSESATGANWWIHDNKRNTTANGNDTDATLHANATTAESGLIDCETDFLSNGFKIRNTSNQANNSSGNYIYLAFAEQPFKYANAK